MEPSRVYHVTLLTANNDKRFTAEQCPSGFYEPLVNVYRSMPSRRFDPNSKLWDFDLKDKSDLIEKLQHLSPKVKVSEKRLAPGETTKKALCMFVLSSLDRFEAVSRYDTTLNNVFKTIPSRAYDASSRSWTFSVAHHDELVETLKKTVTDLAISPLPGWLLKFLRSRNAAVTPDLDEFCRRKLGEDLFSKLLPFQKEALRSCIRNNGRLLLADDMGLGKTLQALCMALLFKSEWPLLIIVPASVKYTWREQILKWIPGTLADEVLVVEHNREPLHGSHYPMTIISYDSLARQSVRSKLLVFKVIIADESHQLKNLKTARCKYVLPLLKKAKRLFLLSGTPALSRPVELYPQLHCLYPHFFRNLHDFGQRYCGAKETNWGWDYSGSTLIKELQIILDSGLMIRREKQDVIENLPGKTRQIVVLDPSAVQTGKESLKQASQKMLTAKGKEKHPQLINYFQETALAKMEAVALYLSQSVDWSEKFIVFAHHLAMLDRVCALCESMAVEYVRIDGTVTSHCRQQLVDRFQQDDRVKVAVLAILAAGSGLNMTAASSVIFAELFWNPGVLLQAEDRAYRIGSEKSVLIRYLIAKQTADDLMWPLVQNKLKVLSEVGLSASDALKTGVVSEQEENTKNFKRAAGTYHLIDEYCTGDESIWDDDTMGDEELLAAADLLGQ